MPGIAGEQHGVQPGHVDARARGRWSTATPSSSPECRARLQRAALLRQVAARGRRRPGRPARGRPRASSRRAVGDDRLGARRERTKATVRTPSATRSASRSAASAVAVRRTGAPCSPVSSVSGGSHSANSSLAARRGVLGRPRTTARPTSRAADTAGSETVAEASTKVGSRAVVGADPPQPAQHRGDVRAEDPPVAVALVDHDVAQVAQEARPSGGARAASRGAACPGWSGRTPRAGGPSRAPRRGCRRRRPPRGRLGRPQLGRATRSWSAASALVGAR